MICPVFCFGRAASDDPANNGGAATVARAALRAVGRRQPCRCVACPCAAVGSRAHASLSRSPSAVHLVLQQLWKGVRSPRLSCRDRLAALPAAGPDSRGVSNSGRRPPERRRSRSPGAPSRRSGWTRR
jgi:hypothetical protein